MKKRNILYGYQCIEGIIKLHPQEMAVVKEIFKAYIEGKSLLELSKCLNERQIEYMPDVIKWNKARIMRILEDKRYLGDDRYSTDHHSARNGKEQIPPTASGRLLPSIYQTRGTA
ncbi:MAG: recombinase family protein [Clostridia bacterium]|nr:recombinase family protein [Clostridia bacterium]